MPPVSDPMSRVRDRNSSFKKASYGKSSLRQDRGMSAGAATQIEDMCPAELHQRKNLVDLLVRRLKSLFWEHIGIHFRPEVFVFKPFGHRTPASCFEERQDPIGKFHLGIASKSFFSASKSSCINNCASLTFNLSWSRPFTPNFLLKYSQI